MNYLPIIVCCLLCGCGAVSDTYRLTKAEPSPDGTLEARLIYREIVDPHNTNWVLQISKRGAKLNGWKDVVIEFPIDHQVGPMRWLDDKRLEVEYRRGKANLRLNDFQTPVNGVTVSLVETK